jgi:hypothetical protein
MVRKCLTVAAAATLAFAGCGHPSEEAGIHEAAREGLAVPIGGLEYNVFITRELNLAVVPDNAYYKGPPAGRDETLYGIFLQVCNREDKPARSAEHFKVVDAQKNEFEPVELSKANDFAYHPRLLRPDDCIPEVGSVAQQGGTAGSMLLFRLPLANTENRPLELEIEGPFNVLEGKRETRKFELDL